ncbi:DUF397 domain-containing protein [Glycomyces sp. L485]|uniref:DUF397 domain-containing protein n=1 Tax=Glycomyces sp. L485 TaxID=2909235 RepID=UPI001F4A69E6|nr:DUF397 domain-containing protein [Glycomyces sp. L485]MCH7231112.1 DUF397 domain-containing protein [Glycomyces sp. L485]
MNEQAREHPLKGRFDVDAARWVRPDAEDGTPGELEIGFAPDCLVAMRRADDPSGTILIYTPEEWEAFVGGVRDGEMDLSVLAADARNATDADADADADADDA